MQLLPYHTKKTHRCPPYGNNCTACGRSNHVELEGWNPSIKLSRDTQREKSRTAHTKHQDAEETEISTKDFDIVRSKVFNFSSVKSIIFAKHKARSSQIVEICKCKIDTGCNGNLMLIKMFKTLFPHSKITNLDRPLDRKIILCTCYNSCLPQMAVSKVTIINNGIECQCSFFVVQGNGPALLGVPDCERLQQL